MTRILDISKKKNKKKQMARVSKGLSEKLQS